MSSHSSGPDRAECPRCSRQFRDRSDLNRHMVRYHDMSDTAVLDADTVRTHSAESIPPEEHYWWIAFDDRIEQYYPLPDDGADPDQVKLNFESGEIDVTDGDGTDILSVDLPESPFDVADLDWGTERDGYIRLTIPK